MSKEISQSPIKRNVSFRINNFWFKKICKLYLKFIILMYKINNCNKYGKNDVKKKIK